jgi:7-carboxy-7-deazaguanine synthase
VYGHGAAMSDHLRVAEISQSTIQGEGPAAGRSMRILRLYGCNLSCGPCDTAHTWDTTRFARRNNMQTMTAEEILHRLPAGVSMFLLTGGEPLLQQRADAFRRLLPRLANRAEVHVETNGTVEPTEWFQQLVSLWVVSPKMAAMPMLRSRQKSAVHSFWRGAPLSAHLKVVCRDAGDAKRAVDLASELEWPRRRVWLMPEGVTTEVLSARWPVIAAAAAEYGVNATHRLHILAGVQ